MSNNSNQNHNATEKYNFCNTQLKTTTEKFIWTIEKFSELQEKCGESLASTEFISTAPNGKVLKWQMKIYPNGSKEEFKDCVSLFLYLIDSNNEEVKAKYQFSIRKSSGIECERFSVRECLKFGGTGHNAWGVNELIKRKILFDEKYGLLNGDRFTVVCTLTVHQRSVEKAPLPDVEVPECRVQEDLAYLFEHSLFPDCKITSEDNKEFKAHKCILGCRSPVFAAMFEHEMIERNSNEVNIVDIKGEVIEKMLRFIYSGKEPDFGNNPKMAAYLLKAAEKYELIRLKLLCERKLINSLGNVNVCALLVLANAYSAQNLKTHAINYVKMNLNEVKKTQGWKLLLANEQLMDEIMTAMAN